MTTPARWLLGPRPARALVRAALLVALAAVVFGWMVLPVRGQGVSMTPTIRDGELILVNRLSYRFRPPGRFDIVAVRMAGASAVYVKRIIGLPGERVRIAGGVVHIDDRPLDEPHVTLRAAWTLDPVAIAPGHYFVIGDNRGMPMRQHEMGLVAAPRLIGAVLF